MSNNESTPLAESVSAQGSRSVTPVHQEPGNVAIRMEPDDAVGTGQVVDPQALGSRPVWESDAGGIL